ncbi:MAG: acyl-CoA thioesterase II [Actinobacteria bacterium]|jgi:acyl-CoA thioesterase-2|nr:acyl-CoA thioesterase II [Actinomycetota bacterium]
MWEIQNVTQSAVDSLLTLLDLESIEVNIFRGGSPPAERQRVFGGQVAGQALVAAARTVEPETRVHSLHAYFLRPGDSRVPILYEVQRIRDGLSFTTRRVTAIQHGRAIFSLSASFQVPEDGFDHSAEMPEVPAPETLPNLQERWAQAAAETGDGRFEFDLPFDLRNCDWGPEDRQKALPPYQRIWLKATGSLPDDPVLHACVLTYASDMTLLDTALLPHGLGPIDDVFMASLDHAMWFHRPFRADEWLLYAQDSPSASGGRGFARGSVFTADGKLAVTVVQEGLVRPPR